MSPFRWPCLPSGALAVPASVSTVSVSLPGTPSCPGLPRPRDGRHGRGPPRMCGLGSQAGKQTRRHARRPPHACAPRGPCRGPDGENSEPGQEHARGAEEWREAGGPAGVGVTMAHNFAGPAPPPQAPSLPPPRLALRCRAQTAWRQECGARRRGSRRRALPCRQRHHHHHHPPHGHIAAPRDAARRSEERMNARLQVSCNASAQRGKKVERSQESTKVLYSGLYGTGSEKLRLLTRCWYLRDGNTATNTSSVLYPHLG